MKKQTDLIIKSINKKNDIMLTKQLASKKQKQYIYTEADLGEGILDIGVSMKYLTVKKDNRVKKANGTIYPMTILQNKNNLRAVLNMESDFNYAYYC